MIRDNVMGKRWKKKHWDDDWNDGWDEKTSRIAIFVDANIEIEECDYHRNVLSD